MIHEIKKPKGTFYTDFTFNRGYVYGIFEHDSRVTHTRAGKTELTNDNYIIKDENGNIKGFKAKVTKTDTHLIIETFE